MRKIAIFVAAVLISTASLAQGVSGRSYTRLSPAEQAINRATELTRTTPRNFQAYNALAVAFLRRARETSDDKFYRQAKDALSQSFDRSPDNIDGQRIQVWLLLGTHEFTTARDAAMKLTGKTPNDIMLYGFLTDANVELGNYKDAEESAQLMLDLRPGNIPGLTRAARLRELFGDNDGAFEMMEMAYQSTPPNEVEDRAWITTGMARLKLATGQTGAADVLTQQALVMFPGYPYALGTLGKVRFQQGRFSEAAELFKQRYITTRHAENLYELAEALQASARQAEAEIAFSEFERASLKESNSAHNSNHELIFYYADHAKQPARALEVARRELSRRRDVSTLDSYAWALCVNGQYAEARKQIDMALMIGTRDAGLYRHAGEITLKVGDGVAADKYFRQSAEINPAGSKSVRTSFSTP